MTSCYKYAKLVLILEQSFRNITTMLTSTETGEKCAEISETLYSPDALAETTSSPPPPRERKRCRR